jgi:hypothetical protein
MILRILRAAGKPPSRILIQSCAEPIVHAALLSSAYVHARNVERGMTLKSKEECLAKAQEAERQAGKAVEKRIKDGLLKIAAAYREMATWMK